MWSFTELFLDGLYDNCMLSQLTGTSVTERLWLGAIWGAETSPGFGGWTCFGCVARVCKSSFYRLESVVSDYSLLPGGLGGRNRG